MMQSFSQPNLITTEIFHMYNHQIYSQKTKIEQTNIGKKVKLLNQVTKGIGVEVPLRGSPSLVGSRPAKSVVHVATRVQIPHPAPLIFLFVGQLHYFLPTILTFSTFIHGATSCPNFLTLLPNADTFHNTS